MLDENDFGQIVWNKAGEHLPPEDPKFRIKRTDDGKVAIKNIGTDVYVEVDCFRLKPKEEWELEDRNIISVYGWKSEPGKSGHSGRCELAYVYGIDPKSFVLVRHRPDRHGASVQVENVTKTFERADKSLAGISDVSFEIAPSTLVGVYGESGIGKSVLINALVAPDGGKLDDGHVYVNGELAAGNPCIAYLPQRMSFPDSLTVNEIIRQGLARTGCTKDRKARILGLCHVNLEVWGKLRFGKLSGGQQRRLALVMALLDPRVRLIVADEPTTGFDIGTEREVMRGLRRLVRLENVTAVVVTHSVFALPIFDKVLVLCKSDAKSGARLCFDSKWLPEYFPSKLREIPQDADRLTELYEGRVSQTLPVRNKFQSPYCYKMSGQGQGVVGRLHSFGSQSFVWICNCLKMAVRQKTFAYFLGLSFLCVLMIQQGTRCNNDHNIFLTFLVLCAPWLCATYTAMFGAELLGWFSWEKLSGGSSRGFCLGVLGGLVLPYACISLIFTLGSLFSLNMERVVGETYVALSRVGGASCITRFLPDDCVNEYDTKVRDRFWPDSQRLWKEPPQLCVNSAQLGCDCSHGAPYSRDHASQNRGTTDSSKFGIWRFGATQWALMTLVCLVGGTIGLAAVAFFRDVKTSVLSIVILFIGFIMVSRICVQTTECMYALKFAAQLRAQSDSRWIPLIYMSYLGLGRYAYNVLVYRLGGAYLYDLYALIGFGVVFVAVALRKLANPILNWRTFER